MATTAADLTWLSYILRDIGVSLRHPPVLFCVNISALSMTTNHVFHTRTKHIELDFHFVREKVNCGLLTTSYVTSSSRLADIFTKALPKSTFQFLLDKLGVLPPSPSSLRGMLKHIRVLMVYSSFQHYLRNSKLKSPSAIKALR